MAFIKKRMAALISAIVGRMKIVQFPINRNDRIGMLHKCWGYVFTNLLRGGYYEFGVYKGETFIESWKIYADFVKWVESQLSSPEKWRKEAVVDFYRYKHEFYGFDTFEGIPENNENNPSFQKGSFFASIDSVNVKCQNAGMKYKLHKGLFSNIRDEIINNLQMAAIVNIDSDIYLSAKDALNKIRTKLQQGTILLMDDYNCFSANKTQGERRALSEFCKENPQFHFEPWFSYQYAGQSFICHFDGSVK